jgi:hypothetical protein
MLKHYPIDAGIRIDGSQSNLLCFNWLDATADFIIPDDPDHVLRVRFLSAVIVRMLDETPLSTETNPDTWEGLIPRHFAYRVEGALFAETQSEVWKLMEGDFSHFRFVTGAGCLDVLCSSEPEFAVVPPPPWVERWT